MKLRIMNIMLTCVLFFLFNTNVDGQTVDEYTLKAIWLGKFSHFIDWPDNSFQNNDTLCIGLYDTDPFNGLLEDIYINRTIEDKPVKIRHINDYKNLEGINILFITENNSNELTSILSNARKHSILLVGDSKGYAEQGVHINFFLSEKRIKFEINESSIRDSGFFVSYRLLNIAKIVEPISSE